MLSFVGFVIALNWIFLLANEMVGLLQALGTIFDISEAIMGLTIFALGNSVGDLVANTAIAKVSLLFFAIGTKVTNILCNIDGLPYYGYFCLLCRSITK
jgi:sodium/potassium/calcium exchanger 6